MKIALISDIHGNRVSLEAVLEDVKKCGAEHIICLGDVATIGPHPHEVTARLREMNIPGITGNHEDYMFQPQNRSAMWADSLAWCDQQLTSDDLDYLRSFQPFIEVPLDDRHHLLCFHGSPNSNKDYIAATTPDDELNTMLTGHMATVMAGGHTHVQMLRRRSAGMLNNVGSVGLPFYRYLPDADEVRIAPWAEYVILTWSNGLPNVEFRRVPVDFDAIRQATESSNNPYNWLPYWFPPDAVGI